MSNTFPKIVNPWLLARNEEHLTGVLNIVDMPAILDSQLKQEGDVFVELFMKTREDGKTVMSGTAKAELDLSCQRCLDAITSEYDVHFSTILVKGERQLEKLGDVEAIICEDDALHIIPFIEQELILSLPMIAKHDSCEINHDNKASEERQNPFENLMNLIK